MRKRFGQSVVGYDPLHVETTLQLMREEHQAELERLRKQLAAAEAEAASLQKKVLLLRQQVAELQSAQQVLQPLFPAYLDAIAQLMGAREDMAQTEQAMERRLGQKRCQLHELQQYLLQLPRDVKAVAWRYRQVLKRTEGNE